MINMENREKLFKQYKSDCPQTIGETDTAFDNDNFIDWLCQQNKQLLDKIERLKLFKVELDNELTKKDKYLEEKERQNHYFNRQVNEIYTKNKVLLDEIELLKFQLKAADSVNNLAR